MCVAFADVRPRLIEALLKPLRSEAVLMEPEVVPPVVLVQRQPRRNLMVAPVVEGNLHTPVFPPLDPRLHVGVPLRHRRLLLLPFLLDAWIGPVERETDDIAREPRVLVERIPNGLIDLLPLRFAEGREELGLPRRLIARRESPIALHAGIRSTFAREARGQWERFGVRELTTELLKSSVLGAIPRPQLHPIQGHACNIQGRTDRLNGERQLSTYYARKSPRFAQYETAQALPTTPHSPAVLGRNGSASSARVISRIDSSDGRAYRSAMRVVVCPSAFAIFCKLML